MNLRKRLDAYRDANAADLARDGATQRLGRADATHSAIPTLAKDVRRAASAQVAARFAYAGRWEPAWLGQRWLGLADMERSWRDKAVKRQIALRRQNWSDSAFGRHPEGDISLFGIDLLDQSETYLLWGRRGEPRVCVYTSSSETCYPNLAAFLKEIVDITRGSLKQPKFYSSFKQAVAEPARVEILSVRVAAKNARIPDFTMFPRLRTLSLSGKLASWREVPSSIWSCSTLRALTLCDTSIEDLSDDLVGLRNLQHLYLVNNRLASLPASLGRLTALESLVCGNNRIEVLPASIGKLSRLERLNCACNALTKLPAQLGKLQQLRELDTSNNRLTSLPRGLFGLRRLHKIDVSGNALRRAPRALLAMKGISTVITDFDDVAKH